MYDVTRHSNLVNEMTMNRLICMFNFVCVCVYVCLDVVADY